MSAVATNPFDQPGLVRVDDVDCVRTVRLDRADALNACNEALYDALTDIFLDAAQDSSVAVVLLTGNGRAFCAGTDLVEMAERVSNPSFQEGRHGFEGMIDVVGSFPKPFIVAVNGLALGIGATILGLCDLAFMSNTARLKCPFTSLGVAPEAGSSYTFPALVGRQNAAWTLLSSEWIGASDAQSMGLVFKVTEPEDLMVEATRHAKVLAAKPISSLVRTKACIIEPRAAELAAARTREVAAFIELIGAPANMEALAAFAEHREPDFRNL